MSASEEYFQSLYAEKMYDKHRLVQLDDGSWVEIEDDDEDQPGHHDLAIKEGRVNSREYGTQSN